MRPVYDDYPCLALLCSEVSHSDVSLANRRVHNTVRVLLLSVLLYYSSNVFVYQGT